MKIQQIYERRKRNLRLAIDTRFDGVERTLARHLGVSPSVINRLFRPAGDPDGRNIGDEKAADYEAAIGLPPGWLDQEHDRAGMQPTLVKTERAMILKSEQIPAYVKRGQIPPNPEFETIPENTTGERVYYMVMTSDTMMNPTPSANLPSFPVGMYALIDADEIPVAGDFVVVQFPRTNHGVLRLLEESDSGRQMLTVLNPEQKSLENCEMPKGTVILGVAVAQHAPVPRGRNANN